MPVRIKCTGFIPYRELSYYPKAELRPLARFKDAKSPYLYANTPALLCEFVIRINQDQDNLCCGNACFVHKNNLKVLCQ